MTHAATLTLDFTETTFAQAQKALEQAYMCHVLTITRFNQSKAAKLAGMSYTAFRERVARLDLTVAARA